MGCAECAQVVPGVEQDAADAAQDRRVGVVEVQADRCDAVGQLEGGADAMS